MLIVISVKNVQISSKIYTRSFMLIVMGSFGTQLQRETSTFLLIFSVVLHSSQTSNEKKIFSN
jgi:hypothetical protein